MALNKKNFIYSISWIVLSIVLFLIGFFIARNSSDEIKTIKRTQILLGTVVEIQVRDADDKKAEDAISKAFAEMKRIEDLFTTFDNKSPVSRINNSAYTIINVESEIYNLIVICDSITKLSNGCFDVSLNNIIRVWGFDSDNRHIPEASVIDSALKLSGWKDVKLFGENKIFKQRKVEFNFGAIAKGYAVDKAINILRKSGIKQALVNAGGEVSVIGNNWIVGIQHPDEINSIIKRIKLNGYTVATSGDYEQYFEVDGVRYHHILDPETGYPSKGLQSVTIINKSNAFADALATAVFVMGEEKGMKLIESLDDTEVMIIDERGRISYSTGFENYIVN
ncbi:MAG: FAD:protein FMN transferase [Ignavibacterium sp.]|nr:FAD:protein FMN transferase [Ignavibacterium sp.]MDX9713653.1 FAD:protein FMN transferase [Ignavibacteriaceae bacterium]MEB2355035.1 FAD:protein FMN transferase [Ignavibacteriales bacterium]GIK21343.1 MAG: thiamine biosynthesis lipoprotein ApbE [Ignavibacteriota bacterium]